MRSNRSASLSEASLWATRCLDTPSRRRCTGPALQKDGPNGGQHHAGAYLPAPILNILALHTVQVPSVAGRPFFMVIDFAFLISRWVLHFMQ